MSMKTVTAYRFDANGYYVGPVEVLYDTQKNKALLPPDCVLCEPLGSGPWRINQAKNGWDCVKAVSELDPLAVLVKHFGNKLVKNFAIALKWCTI